MLIGGTFNPFWSTNWFVFQSHHCSKVEKIIKLIKLGMPFSRLIPSFAPTRKTDFLEKLKYWEPVLNISTHCLKGSSVFYILRWFKKITLFCTILPVRFNFSFYMIHYLVNHWGKKKKCSFFITSQFIVYGYWAGNLFVLLWLPYLLPWEAITPEILTIIHWTQPRNQLCLKIFFSSNCTTKQSVYQGHKAKL